MDGTPQNIGQSLIDELNALRQRNASPGDIAIARLKRNAESLAKVDSVSAHIVLGGIASLEGNSDEMIRCHKIALRIDPNSYNTLFNYGTSLAVSGKYGEALEQFIRLVELGLKNEKILSHVINTAVLIGHYETASTYAEMLNPSSDKAMTTGAIKMNALLKEYKIDEVELHQYCEAMLSVLREKSLSPASVGFYLTEEDQIVRNVSIDQPLETIIDLNEILIDKLCDMNFSEHFLFNFSGYFQPFESKDNM